MQPPPGPPGPPGPPAFPQASLAQRMAAGPPSTSGYGHKTPEQLEAETTEKAGPALLASE